MKKIFTVALLRDLERQVSKGEITYSRMVEILNEKASESYSDRLEPSDPDLRTEYIGNIPILIPSEAQLKKDVRAIEDHRSPKDELTRKKWGES